METIKLSVIFFLICICVKSSAKLNDSNDHSAERSPKRMVSDSLSPSLMFADEFKQTLEKYLFGICPQTYKVPLKGKNITSPACDLDAEQQDLAGRLATLALRAHTASRSDCARLGSALASTLGDLARTAANRQVAAANNDQKKRKLSKSQKMKLQAKQRTALAVKKKAAAAAAAAAAKLTS